MSKKLSQKSRSFGRYKKLGLIYGVNIDNDFIYSNTNIALKEYLKLFNLDEREVFYAENLNIKSSKELKTLLKKLAKYIESESALLNETPKGIVEFHPTSDQTMKNAHIHYWGERVSFVKNFIENFIKIENLSNKYNQNTQTNLKEIKKENPLKNSIKNNLNSLQSELENIDKYLNF